MMTSHLRTTSATAAPAPTVPRKGTKDTATNPGDQIADQFAAMFASLCQAPVSQPQTTPDVKPEIATIATDDLAVLPENTEADNSEAPSTPVISFQTLALGAGKEVPEILPKEVMQEASKPALLPESVMPALQSAALASQPIETATPSVLNQTPVNTTATPMGPSVSVAQSTIAPSAIAPSAIGPSAVAPSTIASSTVATSTSAPSTNSPSTFAPSTNLQMVDAPQPAKEGVSSDLRSRPAADLPTAPDSLVIGNSKLAEEILQSEAARRDANLVAGYLATTTRNDRVAGVRTMLAGNEMDLQGGDTERDSNFGSPMNLLPALADKLSFAAIARDAAVVGASSVPQQAVNQIIALTEAMGTQQTRSLRLRLRPEELGQIDIQLSRDAGGRISAHISAERESARAALSRSLDQLRDTLSRAGLTVDKLEITPGPGHFTSHRESDDSRPSRQESTVVSSLLSGKETAADSPLAEDQKLLSLRA